MEKEVTLIGWRNIVIGFLSGSLIAGGIIGLYDPIVRVFVTLFGFVVLIDAMMSYRDQTHNASCILTAVVGFVVTIFVAAFGTALSGYLIAVFILTILSYTHKIIEKRMKKVR